MGERGPRTGSRSSRAGPALRVHGFLAASRANGPGVRAVVWVQGCSLGCPGCFNPASHSFAGGEEWSTPGLGDRIAALAPDVEGITISGGEPFLQPAALLDLLREIRRRTRLSVVVFSGFSLAELSRLPEFPELREHIDILLAGRFVAAERLARGLLGSANKVPHFFTDRYSPDDLRNVPDCEVVINPDGTLVATGIDPVAMSPQELGK